MENRGPPADLGRLKVVSEESPMRMETAPVRGCVSVLGLIGVMAGRRSVVEAAHSCSCRLGQCAPRCQPASSRSPALPHVLYGNRTESAVRCDMTRRSADAAREHGKSCNLTVICVRRRVSPRSDRFG